jgi:hypothetical protein
LFLFVAVMIFLVFWRRKTRRLRHKDYLRIITFSVTSYRSNILLLEVGHLRRSG